MIRKTLTEIQMQQAVEECFRNPTIAIHSIAVDFGIKNRKRLHIEYRKQYLQRKGSRK